MNEVPEFAEFVSGDKLYQQRARRALPLLVRQAQLRKQTTYSDLADELEMPNPRNLNNVLGYVGEALQALSRKWDEDIPPIQCLVVSERTGLPGEGIWWFITPENDFHSLTRDGQRTVLLGELQKVFGYPKWPVVLRELGLLATSRDSIISRASEFHGGGESEQHRELKEYVAEHPEALQLTPDVRTDIEFRLPSGDSLDVLFRVDGDWIAAEVKSTRSSLSDIARGIFQCVKYKAVVTALQIAEGFPQSAKAILVLEGQFPGELSVLQQTLGIEVVDLVRER